MKKLNKIILGLTAAFVLTMGITACSGMNDVPAGDNLEDVMKGSDDSWLLGTWRRQITTEAQTNIPGIDASDLADTNDVDETVVINAENLADEKENLEEMMDFDSVLSELNKSLSEAPVTIKIKSNCYAVINKERTHIEVGYKIKASFLTFNVKLNTIMTMDKN